MIRKILKITLTVLISLILLITAFLLIVSHNPSFYRMVYPGIDDTMSDYPLTDVSVPADFVTRTAHGINIRAPKEHINNPKLPGTGGSTPFKSDTLTVFVQSLSEDYKFSSDIKEPFSDKDYEHYFKNLGIEKPDNMRDKIVYIRDKFNAECCRNLHLKDLLIFNFEAYGKKIAADMETPYFYHGSNFDGLVCEIPAKRKMTNVVISNPELRYHVTITIICNDTELTNQIIAGIDPSPFLAGDVL